MKRRAVNEKLKQLDECNQRLSGFLEKAARLQDDGLPSYANPSGPQLPVRFVASLESIRNNASRVHRGLSRSWCRAHGAHQAGLLLEQRLARRRRRDGAGPPPSVSSASRFGVCILMEPTPTWFDTEFSLYTGDTESVDLWYVTYSCGTPPTFSVFFLLRLHNPLTLPRNLTPSNTPCRCIDTSLVYIYVCVYLLRPVSTIFVSHSLTVCLLHPYTVGLTTWKICTRPSKVPKVTFSGPNSAEAQPAPDSVAASIQETVTNICSKLQVATYPILGFSLDALDVLRGCSHVRQSPRQLPIASSVSLGDSLHTLKRDILPYRDFYALAITLVCSVLQLGNTPWLRQPWNRHTIRFHLRGSAGSCSVDVEHPYLTRRYPASKPQFHTE